MNKQEIQLAQKAFPTWAWILSVPKKDQPLLQEIISSMLDSDLSLLYWQDQDLYKYFSLLIEDQGVQAGLREYGYWILTKYLQIKSYEEYLDRYDEIRKFAYHNLNNNLIINNPE